MSNGALSSKDANAAMRDNTAAADKSDVKSMEYHRQVFQSKMAEQPTQQYVSPSDNIMSPCTAKISALRSKQVSKVKPKSLFAQASANKMQGESRSGSNPF